MRLTLDEVRHIATLARVGMTEEELGIMREEMSHILENFDVLSRLDTQDVEPTGHSVDLETILRADEVRDSSPRDSIIANAPAVEGDFIKTKAVLE